MFLKKLSAIPNEGMNEGFSLVQDILKEKKPEVIIWGIDYWWFNESEHKFEEEIKPPTELSHHISLRSYSLPYCWLWERKISFDEFFAGIHFKNLIKKEFKQGIGVDALVNQQGYGLDGSYFYTKIVTGKQRSKDEKLKKSFDDIKLRNKDYAPQISERQFQQFLTMLNFIQSQGIYVVLFIPPVAPSVAETIETYDNTRKFIADLRNHLNEANIVYHDFHHPKNTNDCEFLDGTHGGEVFYAKILAHLANKDPILRSYVDMSYLNKAMQLRNLTMIPNPAVSTSPEVDYLQLGCDKSAQFSGLLKNSS